MKMFLLYIKYRKTITSFCICKLNLLNTKLISPWKDIFTLVYQTCMLSVLQPTSSYRKNSSEELQELLVRNGGKILHSSKEALLVTKKQYLRKDWCRTEPLVQEVREEGCAPTSVLNNFCYGQCNSFFIPRGSRRKVRILTSRVGIFIR